MSAIFSSKAQWIWNGSDPFGYNVYLRARRTFRLPTRSLQTILREDSARLKITADFAYQAWVNGKVAGHGPAKSPQGERFVDRLPVSHLLREGENLLEILALSLGTGTMTYVAGEAGLIFELEGPSLLVPSDARTLVQRDPQRRKTTRRWVLPCAEDIDARAHSPRWQPAKVVKKTCRLRLRPIGMPVRRPATVERLVAADFVIPPDFSLTFRIKPYLVPSTQQRLTTVYERRAFIVTDILSPRAQTLTFSPAPGQITWYFEGERIIESSGWGLWFPNEQKPVVRLKKGANRLIGLHRHNFFDDIHLAGFCPHPVTFRNPFGRGGFQVALPPEEKRKTDDPGVATSALEGEGGKFPVRLPKTFVRELSASVCPVMDPQDTLPGANIQSFAVGALVDKTAPLDKSPLQADGKILLPPSQGSKVPRLIVDLGRIENGWLAFRAHGSAGSRLLFSFFEGLNGIQPFRPHWPEACNNALSYRLRDGWQDFESFLPCGVRYVAIHHEGNHPVQIADLAMLSANCGHASEGSFLSDDLTLNAIYAMCERTLFAATDDTLTDCPTYEQVNWNFDNRLGAMGDLVIGRNTRIIRNTLAQFAHDPRYPGLVCCHYPSSWDVRIPVFSFHWIIACVEFFQHTGDRRFLDEVAPVIAAGLAEAESYLSPLGLLAWPGGGNVWHIIDWQKERDDNHAVVSAEQALFLGALDAVLALGHTMGTGRHVRRWSALRKSLKTALEKHLWIKERDAFADSLHADGAPSPVSSEPSNAALALHGAGSPAWRKRLARRLAGGNSGLLRYGSPMGLFYVLELLDAQGEAETLFRIIREKWSPMLKAGDGTAWEHFPEYGWPGAPTRSRCHPFATYIIKYFVKYLLGLSPVDAQPGTRRFQPRPPSGVTQCQGIVPSAQGDFRISWTKEKGRLRKSIHAPGKIQILS